MNDVISTTLIALGTGLAGSVTTWLFGRKKERIDNSQSEITSIDMATDAWKKIVDSLKQQVSDLVDEVKEARVENEELKELIEKLTTDVKQLKKLQSKVNSYEKKIKVLESALANCNGGVQTNKRSS